jgi:hypothetical protein
MKVVPVLVFLLIYINCFSFKDKIVNNVISVTYSIDTINENLFKVRFQLKNNDSVNYFIPFIKPAYKYCKFSDEKLSDWIQSGLAIDVYLTNKNLTREDLMETAELDSMFYDKKNDTVYFYFKEPFVKRYYDLILSNYKNKKRLNFIYPNFYHAIGNGCVYIKKDSTQSIIVYVPRYYLKKPNELKINFNFDTKTIPDYKEKYFKNIPDYIEGYVLFKGQIKLNP